MKTFVPFKAISPWFIFYRVHLQFVYHFIFIALFSISTFAQAGRDGAASYNSSGSSVIMNRYSALTKPANAGDTAVTVSDINDLSSSASFTNSVNPYAIGGLSTGDLVMIIQMQGADISTANDSTYGTITNYNGTGNYEVKPVWYVNGNSIVFCSSLTNSYMASGRGRTQVIRIPRLSSLFVGSGVTLTGKPWDGATGGIVAAETQADIIIAGKIAADTIGFRGGFDNVNQADKGEWMFVTTDDVKAAEKGEGIAGNTSDYDLMGGREGRGAPANAGGGGDSHNPGGGGGSNAGIQHNLSGYNGSGIKSLAGGLFNWALAWNFEAPGFANNVSPGGGRGGYSFSNTLLDPLLLGPTLAAWGGDNRNNNGGFGGHPLDYESSKHLFMGGGGGSGNGNNQSSGFGGRGAGIIYLFSNGNISGSGGSAVISANGQNGFNTNNEERDGTGGAGGGGAIIALAAGAINNLAINANGGSGGNQLFINTTYKNSEAEGPGGGGGGGYVLTTPTAVTITTSGGANGFTNSNQILGFKANGATMGAGGSSDVQATVKPFYDCATILELNTVVLSGTYSNKVTDLQWKADNNNAVDHFEIEKSDNGSHFFTLTSVPENKTTYNYSDYTGISGSEYAWYRLKVYGKNGSVHYTNILRFKADANAQSSAISLYPNPTAEQATITLSLQQAQAFTVQLFDASGKLYRRESHMGNKGTNAFTIDQLSKYPKGTYVLQVVTGSSINTQKLVIR